MFIDSSRSTFWDETVVLWKTKKTIKVFIVIFISHLIELKNEMQFKLECEINNEPIFSLKNPQHPN